VIAACNTPPFLGEHRLVVVEGLLKLVEGGSGRGRRKRDAGPLAEAWAALSRSVPEMPESTILVLVDGAVSAANPMLADLRPRAEVLEFAPPADLARWVQARASAAGCNMDPRAARRLAQLIGRYNPKRRDNKEYLDTWSAASELDKLSAYANGGPIREEDVDRLTTSLLEQKGYLLCDAIIERRPANAARLLHEVLQHDVPQLVLATIAGRYRRLAIARELMDKGAGGQEIGRELASSGFALDHIMEQASRYSLEDIRSAYRRVVQADFSHKSGDAEEVLSLEILVQDLASAGAGARRSA
jgi:DNA polymerase III delta subunit